MSARWPARCGERTAGGCGVACLRASWLEGLRPTPQAVAACATAYATYHQTRMQYPTYVICGLPMGSGRMEGADEPNQNALAPSRRASRGHLAGWADRAAGTRVGRPSPSDAPHEVPC